MIIENTAKEYKKGSSDPQTFPFILVPSLQKALFVKHLDSIQSITLRAVFDAYMTSYFGAWINNQNANGSKKFVTVFTPRLSTQAPNMEFLFDISRRSLNFACQGTKELASVWTQALAGQIQRSGGALSQWNESAMAELRNKEQYGDRVCIIKFEDLVSQTEAVMRYLAEFLGIQIDQILLAPTFNKFPMKAHADFVEENHGIGSRPPIRPKTLSAQELDTIERMTCEIYPRVLNEAVKFE